MRNIKRILSGIVTAAVVANSATALLAFAESTSIYPKINYTDVGVSTEASDQGSDGTSNSNAVIDGVTNQTGGAYKWYIAGNKLTDANLTIILPEKYKIDKLVLYSGYIARDPAVVNTEANKPNNTAEIPFKYQFEYADGSGDFVLIPGTKADKEFDGLTVDDREVTFEFDEIETDKIRFVSLNGNYNFRIREIVLYGVPVEGETGERAPEVTVETVTDAVAESDVTLCANVSANNNNINKVEFYNGDVFLGEGMQNSDKYEYTVLSAAGSYSITAKVTYNDDKTVISEPMTFTAEYEDPGTNIALNKIASASYYSAANGGPTVLTDGEKNVTTGTSVLFVDQNKTNDVEIDIDLEDIYDVDKVILYHGMGTPRTQTLSSFELQYSAKAGTVTDADYVTLKTITGAIENPWTIVLDEPVSAGHLRLVSNMENSASNMFRLLEIEVYGTEVKQPPAVTMDKIDDIIAGSSVTLCARVTDNGNIIDKVEFYDNSTFLGEGILNGDKYEYTFADAAEGSHSITAVVTYGENQTVTSEERTFTVMAFPEPGAPLPVMDAVNDAAEGDTVALSATVNDNGNTIIKVEFLNNNTELVGTAVLDNGKYIFEWINVPAGTYRISAKVTYGTDKEVNSPAVSFTVMAKPAIEVEPVGNVTAGDSVTLRASVEDNGNAIDTVEFFDNNVFLGTAALNDGKYEYIMSDVADGSHSITAIVTYGTGRTVTSPAVTFMAVSDPDELFDITIESPAEDEDLQPDTDFAVRAVITDTRQMLSEVVFYINDREIGRFLPSSDDIYAAEVKAEPGTNTIIVEAIASDGTAQRKSLEKTITYPKIVYDNSFKATASQNGSDSSSTPGAVIDNSFASDVGSNKWYINQDDVSGSYLTIELPDDHRLNRLVLYSGYVTRDPEEVNTEANKPNGTAEIPFMYQFEYEQEDGTFAVIPGTTVEKTFDGLVNADKIVTFDFPEIQTSKVRFVSLPGNYAYRLREIELYGYSPNQAPTVELTELPNNGLVMTDAELTLSAQVLDKENDIRSVCLYIDGSRSEAVFEQNEGTYTTVIQCDSLGKGEHTLQVRAIDGYMAEGESNLVTVNVSDEQDILNVLNNSTRADIVENLNFTAEQLKLNLTSFQGLSQSKKEKVYLALLDEEFTSAKDLQDFLDDYIRGLNEQSGSTEKPSGGGSASGGGGGATGVGITVKPTVKPTEGPALSTPQPSQTEDAEKKRFTDLDETPWAETAVLYLAECGAINGVDDDKFAPLAYVTRGQFAKMLIGALGLLQSDAQADFADVAPDDEFFPYIASAQQLGIVNGLGNGTFGPNDEITREDLGVMMVRAAAAAKIELPAQIEEETFSDDGMIADYAKEAISSLQRAGIMNGIGNGMFAPKDSANRAMAAKVIYELMNLR